MQQPMNTRPIPKPRKSLQRPPQISTSFLTSEGSLICDTQVVPGYSKDYYNPPDGNQNLVASEKPPLPPRQFNGLELLPPPIPINGDHLSTRSNSSDTDNSCCGSQNDSLNNVSTCSPSEPWIAGCFSSSNEEGASKNGSFNFDIFDIMPSDGESICFSGWVKGLFSNSKERVMWVVIRNNHLYLNKSDEIENQSSFGVFDLSKLLFSGRSAFKRSEITILLRGINRKNNETEVLTTLKLTPDENMEFWLAILAKCHCPKNNLIQSSLNLVDGCGKIWIKRGVSGSWSEGWAHVYNRMLYYWSQSSGSIAEVDIRKVILIKNCDIPTSDWCNFIEHSSSPILIALEGSSIYLQSSFERCNALWFEFLRGELNRNGDTLDESRLTIDGVPVIVDKCIKLVSTYGLRQPGIYRKNGSASEAKKLIKRFTDDPYYVCLESTTDDSINAVADVLRSYFRQLSKPLVPADSHDRLFEILNYDDVELKIHSYHEIIYSFPEIYLRTLRKLLAHLQEIISHSDTNFASLDNICKIFGPTIFHIDKPGEKISEESFARTSLYVLVTRDLLLFFDEIFEVGTDEISAKIKLESIHQEHDHKIKTLAKGFLIPIHLFQKDNKCFNVQSDWTAKQVVSFKMDPIETAVSHALFEILKNGQLERRLNGDEILTHIVLGRWMEWGEHLCGYLLLKKDEYPFNSQNVRPFADDIKFAEPGSKSFKNAHLRIESGSKVVHYSKDMKKKTQWSIDEMLWYIGAESERKIPNNYPLTFFIIEGQQKSRSKTKFAGYCVSFKGEIERYQWLNSIIICKQEYLPTPLIQI